MLYTTHNSHELPSFFQYYCITDAEKQTVPPESVYIDLCFALFSMDEKDHKHKLGLQLKHRHSLA